MKTLFIKIIAYGLTGLALASFGASSALAETPLESIELKLSIEVQDLDSSDFDDDGETIEKERIVIYSLAVTNKSAKTQTDLRLFMDSPDYMEYRAGTTQVKEGEYQAMLVGIPDEGGYSPLALGYFLEELPAGETYTYQAKYQVVTKDDPSYAVAWASLVGPYSAIPVMSNTVNTIISGEAIGNPGVLVTSLPPEGEVVFSGSEITYQYTLTNSGGLALQNVALVTYLPEGTVCVENCGMKILKEDLAAYESVTIDMKIKVTTTDPNKDFITHTGYGVSHLNKELEDVEKIINHPLNAEIEVGSGEFTLFTEQVPNLILNSANGQPRLDQGDMTETQYAIEYTGRGKPNTFSPGISGFGVREQGPNYYDHACGREYYDHGILSTVYAYNSSGGGCEKMSASCISSSQIIFQISTTLPSDSPDLIFSGGSHIKTEPYAYPPSYPYTASVNRFMQSTGAIKVPPNFTLSRAIEDGALGSVDSTVTAAGIREDKWTYEIVGYNSVSCNCGEDGCTTATYPIYAWQLLSQNSVVIPTLSDDDTTNISVYSSTAWLKTEGGHIGTNGYISSEETESNKVDLPFGNEKPYMNPNEYVKDDFYTATNEYTKYNETNADYMIFANQGNADGYVSASGDEWVVTGTNFGNQQYGDAYDRENNPRSYAEDLLLREKYGQVYENKLVSPLQGSIDIQDDVVWHQRGNLTIGVEGVADKVTITGGQSRIYVEGDVYINANIYYDSSGGSGYNDATSLRIDAQNIFVSGEVTDLEVLLQARGEFHSGESHDQLRILGDVITGSAKWERKPVLEIDPDDVNKPSEHIIEDYRKYVIPVPGDTELPDEYDIWRQVNPSTGQVLDAY